MKHAFSNISIYYDNFLLIQNLISEDKHSIDWIQKPLIEVSGFFEKCFKIKAFKELLLQSTCLSLIH